MACDADRVVRMSRPATCSRSAPRSDRERALLNGFQRGFPFVGEPFEILAQRIGATTPEVIASLQASTGSGAISRIGAVFAPGAIGSSTLAALAVPSVQLASVAAAVSRHPEVSHNYARADHVNLWFVVSAADLSSRAAVLAAIAEETGLAPLAMPLVEEYHIDLGFDLDEPNATLRHPAVRQPARITLTPVQSRLASRLQQGLPIVVRPFAAIAADVGATETQVLDVLQAWTTEGVIRRFGIIVRHFELGFGANAMAVWDIEDDRVAAVGLQLAELPSVRLAYRRERVPGRWPFNLYAMIHAREQSALQSELAAAKRIVGPYPSKLLATVERYKQRAAQFALQGGGEAWTKSTASS